MLRFILQAEDPSVEALAARVAALEGGAPPLPVPPAPTPPPAPKPAPRAPNPVPIAEPPPVVARVAPAAVPPIDDLTLNKVRSLWSSVRARAEGEKASLSASLGRATIEDVSDDEIVLRMPDPLTADALRRSIDVLERAIAGVVGRPVRARVIVGAAPASESHAGAEAPAESPDDVAQYAFDRLL
jgi:hypothetical protein